MHKLYILIAVLAGLSTFQFVGIMMLSHELKIAQETSGAALQVAQEARALAFEAKRIADSKETPPPPAPSCDPESGRCHRGYTYREFMGGKP